MCPAATRIGTSTVIQTIDSVNHVARIAWLLIGAVALALGSLGIVLPLLPTTPFLLVAAFAFARSSNRLHTWLVEHDVFGALIRNWRDHGAISRRAKIVALLTMGAVLVISWLHGVPTTVLIVQALVLSASGAFVASRPSPPE